ncbi:MAG TPA: hypothetical protein VE523_08795 [Solirubrobacterales bacterium]|jgi:hypothetical protein|nr:hypothetical protein [Solirubrobacterales bacterium]
MNELNSLFGLGVEIVLMPGSEEEAAGLLDNYLDTQLAAADVRARGATGELSGEQLASQPRKAHV